MSRRRRYAQLYAAAERRAVETSKMLVVVGNPIAGTSLVLGPAYGCGDVCVDEQGCPTCATHLAGPLVDILSRFDRDSAVVFVANAIERAPDGRALIEQLSRVAGHDLFVAHLEPTSLAAWVTQRRVYVAPAGPGTQMQVIYRPNPWSTEPPQELQVVPLAALPVTPVYPHPHAAGPVIDVEGS